jgi:septal ring factor EnvC (AmiA/AmiB activator)
MPMADAKRPIGGALRRCYPAHMGSFTAALLDALLSVGISPERARNVVELFDKSIDERYGLHAQVLATKRDVAEINASLGREIAQTKVEIAETRAEIARTRAELKRDIAQLETRLSRDIAATNARIAETKADLTRWMLGALTAQTALLLGAMKLL